MKGSSTLSAEIMLGVALALGLCLRVLGSDHPFESSDNAELALRVLDHHGITWVFGERYGFLNPLAVKVFSALTSDAINRPINEWLFKLPVALMGTAQIALSFAFARRLQLDSMSAAIVALVTAVFPLHVMQSRYLWGYEVFGLFFLTIALWKLFDFYERPSASNALASGAATAVYLVSHGFIVPFFPLFAVVATLMGGVRALSLFRDHRAVWVVPLLYAPFLAPALQHTADKNAKLGFYLFDYAEPMLANLGWPLVLVFSTGATLWLFRVRAGRDLMIFYGGGVLYLMPLVFGAAPGSTVTRGYMLVGAYLLVFAALVSLLRSPPAIRRWTGPFLALTVVSTGYGVGESIFQRDQGYDVTGIRGERGVVPLDPGTKTAGVYVRQHVPAEARLLAVHLGLEPPNARYYLGRTTRAFFDLPLDELDEKLIQHAAESDVILAAPELDPGPDFETVCDVFAEGQRVLVVYARPELGLPRAHWETAEHNQVFDRDHAPIARF
ncbi:MAG: hypothetical protein AAF658_02300 [Myxococcota bacterium]